MNKKSPTPLRLLPFSISHFPSRLKDPMSGLTHFIGFLLSIAALVVLIVKGVKINSPWHIVTYSIFGSGLILLYLASTLYHWIPIHGRGERILRRLDHIMIFVLIAASYTPVCLIPLRGGWGWSIFGVVWGIAILGILFKVFYIHAPDWLAATIYVGLGWMALIAIVPLVSRLQVPALIWLFLGGIFYSVGAIIYAIEKPRLWPNVFGAHDLFHILVMLGSGAHFWLMYRYIADMV